MKNESQNYQILGLKPGVSIDEVKRAYRDMIKVWHPDRFCHDQRLQLKAQEQLKKINVAYDYIRLQLIQYPKGNTEFSSAKDVEQQKSKSAKQSKYKYEHSHSENATMGWKPIIFVGSLIIIFYLATGKQSVYPDSPKSQFSFDSNESRNPNSNYDSMQLSEENNGLNFNNDYIVLTHLLGGATKTQDENFYKEFDDYVLTIRTYSESKFDSLKLFANEYISYTNTFHESVIKSINLYISERITAMPQFEKSIQHVRMMKKFGLPDEIIQKFNKMNSEISQVLNDMYENINESNDIDTLLMFLSYTEINKEIQFLTMQNAFDKLFKQL